MVKEISKSIEDLVNSIDNTIELAYNTALMRSNTCATKWARVGKPLASDVGEEFYLSGIEPNEWLKAGDNELNGTYYLPRPYFISGTKIATNREWTIATPNLLEKTPIVWLLYDLEYKNYGRGNTLDWETNIRLFFLDETDVSNYYTKDHTDNVVIPMSLLAEEFIKVVEEDRNFLTVEEYDVINFTRFGTEQENGYFQNILDANLSGVELRIKLSKYKDTTCKC
mgnify:CR=1 FL=1|tara:strand:- start:286 stop:960 length:675 start_codon:yes stop_codon:yes gene_type:complete